MEFIDQLESFTLGVAIIFCLGAIAITVARFLIDKIIGSR